MVEVPLEPKSTVALLCVGEPDGQGALPIAPLFGQPVIHHVIKQLEALGISKFFIGVENVPGALLAYGDYAKSAGLDVQFVREPQALAGQIDVQTRVLLMRADIVFSQKVLAPLLNETLPFICTVEERPENENFERIDLNNRWAGLAMVDRRSLEGIVALPEGWDMASSLLRQSIQDKSRFLPIRQTDLQAGLVQKLNSAADLNQASAMFVPHRFSDVSTLENKIFVPFAPKVAALIWGAQWRRTATEWLFPAMAISSAVLAFADVALGAALVAMLAIFAALARTYAHDAEYRRGYPDWIGVAAWVVLIAALVAVLQMPGSSLADAAFLAIALSALSRLDAYVAGHDGLQMLSPLIIALALMIGIAGGVADWAARLLILAGLAISLYRLKKHDEANTVRN
jgi:hypothetical protein